MPRTQEEFEEFAFARTPQLYRAAWLMCGDAHRAEDLVQDTLAKVYVRWHRRLGPPIDHPVAYAHKTLARTYISAQRRRSMHERPTEHVPELASPDDGAATRLALRAALDQLAPLDRAVLVLRYLEDVSVADTADALAVSPGAVRNRTLRALERLRAVLGTASSCPSFPTTPRRARTSLRSWPSRRSRWTSWPRSPPARSGSAELA